MDPEPLPDEGPEEITPEMQAALEALMSEPFPKKPYALSPTDGVHNDRDQDYIIHRDYENERQCVIIFDSIVDAFAVAEQYKEATGKEAEPVECDIFALEEDRYWVKFYRANGAIAMLSLDEYKRHIGHTRDY